jgi:hypothetical protein
MSSATKISQSMNPVNRPVINFYDRHFTITASGIRFNISDLGMTGNSVKTPVYFPEISVSGFNVYDLSHSIYEPGFSVYVQSHSVYERSFCIYGQSFSIYEPGLSIYVQSQGICERSFCIYGQSFKASDCSFKAGDSKNYLHDNIHPFLFMYH